MSEEKNEPTQQDTHDWRREAHRQAVMRIVETAHRKKPFYDKRWTAKVLFERSDSRHSLPSPDL
jgi:tyrosine-protein phosphatase YwqE